MPQSLNLTDAAAYQGFVREFSQDMISRAFFGNQTASIATPHMGVKGKKVLNIMSLETIGRRWALAFNATNNLLKITPRELVVERGKFEFRFAPQEFYDTYLGQFAAGTFPNTGSFPFQSFVMEKIAQKKAQELEIAMWRGDKPTTPAATDDLSKLINGWLTLITDDLAATTPKLTPVATPTGAVTLANVVPLMETMYDQMLPEYQDMPCAVFVSPRVFSLYQRAYRESFSKFTTNAQPGRMKLDFCDFELIRTPGMGTSQRVVMTPKENLHYGFDGLNDPQLFNFESDKRELHYWSDFLFGVEFGLFEQGVIVVNDLV